MYYYEGFSAQEVAQALGVPRPTACMRLSRGRKRTAMADRDRREKRTMKHDAFDEALRRRAQREKSALSTQAEERVARAIREGPSPRRVSC